MKKNRNTSHQRFSSVWEKAHFFQSDYQNAPREKSLFSKGAQSQALDHRSFPWIFLDFSNGKFVIPFRPSRVNLRVPGAALRLQADSLRTGLGPSFQGSRIARYTPRSQNIRSYTYDPVAFEKARIFIQFARCRLPDSSALIILLWVCLLVWRIRRNGGFAFFFVLTFGSYIRFF